MLPHPHLWPALIGAALGLTAITYAAAWLMRRWPRLRPPLRWGACALLVLVGASYSLSVYAWLIEPNMLVVQRVELESERWHGAPLTLAVISDTHVGSPHVDAARIGRVVERVNRLHPDLVVLLGDYVGGHAPEAERSPREQQEILGGVATFAALRAPLGIVGVLGNHDVWYGRQSIVRAMEEAGVAALWNRNVVVSREGGDVVVAGLADLDTGNPDFTAALDGAPEDVDTIVLSHSPDTFSDMPAGPALMLSGHGHCGQVTIPFVGRPLVPLRNKRYACHLIGERGAWLYVSAGIGTSIVPVRFLNPPEIVLITIRPATTVGSA